MFSNPYYVWILISINSIAIRTSVLCQDVNETMTYLQHFGYKTKNRNITESIKLFQKYAGIEMTGEMDKQTQAVMEMARCGSDKPETIKGPYHGSRWTPRNLTYNILDYPKYLVKERVDQVIAEAFDQWSKVVGFQFTKAKRNAIITIRFDYRPNVKNMNGDIILASGKYPIHGGHITFNADIHFTTEDSTNSTTYNLYQVAVHEIGHSLGLLHSSYSNSIMSPFIETELSAKNVHIHPSDKKKLRKLYGFVTPQSLTANTTRLTETSKELPSICKLTKMDAIIAYAESELYVFNEGDFWLLDAWTDVIVFNEEEYPKKIGVYWKGAPSTIDTAFVDIDNATYFFKGDRCWKYLSEQDTIAPGFPKNISEEFPGIPNEINAVMEWDNGKIYFFKGNQYWGFNRNEKLVHPDYPKPITRWVNVTNGIDAALYFHQYTDEVYFFKDMLYYKYFEEGHSPTIRNFPRHTTLWWFNC